MKSAKKLIAPTSSTNLSATDDGPLVLRSARTYLLCMPDARLGSLGPVSRVSPSLCHRKLLLTATNAIAAPPKLRGPDNRRFSTT